MLQMYKNSDINYIERKIYMNIFSEMRINFLNSNTKVRSQKENTYSITVSKFKIS